MLNKMIEGRISERFGKIKLSDAEFDKLDKWLFEHTLFCLFHKSVSIIYPDDSGVMIVSRFAKEVYREKLLENFAFYSKVNRDKADGQFSLNAHFLTKKGDLRSFVLFFRKSKNGLPVITKYAIQKPLGL